MARSTEIDVVIEAIRLAPSVHNVQPWCLEVRGEDRLRVLWKRDRWLPVLDPEGRATCYSMGCALQAASTVADLEITPSDATDPLDPDWFAGDLTVVGLKERHDEALDLLRERCTNRSHFDTDFLPRELLDELVQASGRHGIQLHVVEDRGRIEMLGEVCAAATRQLMGRPEFLDETLEWIRIDDSPVDGLTLDGMQLDETGRTVFQTIKQDEAARKAVVEAGMPEIAAQRSAEAMGSCGAALFSTAAEQSAANWLAGGRAMLDVWLRLTKAGVSLQPMTDTLLFPEERAKIFEAFDVDPSRDPMVMVRVGYSHVTVPPAPRQPADAFVLDRQAEFQVT